MLTRYDEQSKAMVCIPEKDITVDNSPELTTLCEKIIKGGVLNIIVNFSKVSYIDSSGLATLVAMLKKLKGHKGQLKISNVSGKVKGLFEITKLDKLFTLYGSEEEAVKSFSA